MRDKRRENVRLYVFYIKNLYTSISLTKKKRNHKTIYNFSSKTH